MKPCMRELRDTVRVALEVVIETAFTPEMQTVALHDFICKVCRRKWGCRGWKDVKDEYKALKVLMKDDGIIAEMGNIVIQAHDVGMSKDLVN